MNVHAIPTRIAPNLTLLGFGGSVPSFTPEGQQVWEGFPYDSDDKFSGDVKLLLDEVVSNDAIPPKETLLLMTHNGPSNSSEWVRSQTYDQWSPKAVNAQWSTVFHYF